MPDSATFLPALVEYLTEHRLAVDPHWPCGEVINQCWGAERPTFKQIADMLSADI